MSLRRVSKKNAKRIAETKDFRRRFRAEVGECELCESSPEYPNWDLPREMSELTVHEIARGPNRSKALDQRHAILCACVHCNMGPLNDKGEYPEARQLAILFQRRPNDFDLEAYLSLTSPNAMSRITRDEIEAYFPMEKLKVEEVASLLQVNRRTVQKWIDADELTAADVRPPGGVRAMWRIDYADLLDFVERRKRRDSAEHSPDEEDLLD